MILVKRKTVSCYIWCSMKRAAASTANIAKCHCHFYCSKWSFIGSSGLKRFISYLSLLISGSICAIKVWRFILSQGFYFWSSFTLWHNKAGGDSSLYLPSWLSVTKQLRQPCNVKNMVSSKFDERVFSWKVYYWLIKFKKSFFYIEAIRN